MAADGLPLVKQVSPATFGEVLSAGEIALGAALHGPIVPSAVAGAALTAFSGLIQMHLDTPGLTEDDGVRPTQDGIGIAKDIWLVGAGLTLVASGLAARRAARKVAGTSVG